MRASHIKTFRGHGSFISSNLVGETHVPRNAPGTPQANARFRPPGTHARSADESEESGRACGQRAGSGGSRTGSVREHRAPEGDTEGDSSAGLGRSKGLGENRVMGPGRTRGPRTSKRTVGPRTVRPPIRDSANSGQKRPRPSGNQRCDPAGPAAVAEMPGPIRWDTAPSWSPHNPRTPTCVTSARPRTPRRCWREYARAH